MLVALLVVAVAVGSVVFHLVSPWWWTPIASNWGFIDTTIIITFWVTGVVYVGVLLFVGYCIWKYRHKEGAKKSQASYEPENKPLEVWLTVLTAVGVAVMLAPGLIAWQQYITVPEGAAQFEVMGQQWAWNYRLPGADGKLGKSDARDITPDNPFGLNKNDPAAQDDILIQADDLHLPINKPVKVLLRAIDVLHDFYVPQFRAKMDMIPGTVTYFWFTPTRAGTYDVLCAELCGVGHYAMRSTVVVDSESDYQAWLSEQETFADLLAQAGGGEQKNVDVASTQKTGATGRPATAE